MAFHVNGRGLKQLLHKAFRLSALTQGGASDGDGARSMGWVVDDDVSAGLCLQGPQGGSPGTNEFAHVFGGTGEREGGWVE